MMINLLPSSLTQWTRILGLSSHRVQNYDLNLNAIIRFLNECSSISRNICLFEKQANLYNTPVESLKIFLEYLLY